MRPLLLTIILLVTLALPAFAANDGRNFGGVGIDGVPNAKGEIVVRQVVAGGPAHLAGVRLGDVITQIDGTPCAGNDFKFLVDRRLRGKPGTKVLLIVRRKGVAKPLRYELTRRQIIVPPKR